MSITAVTNTSSMRATPLMNQTSTSPSLAWRPNLNRTLSIMHLP